MPTLNSEMRGGHLYAIYAQHVVVCRVVARNRDHAARIAERAGYSVGSVNMEG